MRDAQTLIYQEVRIENLASLSVPVKDRQSRISMMNYSRSALRLPRILISLARMLMPSNAFVFQNTSDPPRPKSNDELSKEGNRTQNPHRADPTIEQDGQR